MPRARTATIATNARPRIARTRVRVYKNTPVTATLKRLLAATTGATTIKDRITAKSTLPDFGRWALLANCLIGRFCLSIWFYGFWYWFEPVFVMVLTNFCWLGSLREVSQ
jgi:hypothetical protein